MEGELKAWVQNPASLPPPTRHPHREYSFCLISNTEKKSMHWYTARKVTQPLNLAKTLEGPFDESVWREASYCFVCLHFLSSTYCCAKSKNYLIDGPSPQEPLLVPAGTVKWIEKLVTSFTKETALLPLQTRLLCLTSPPKAKNPFTDKSTHIHRSGLVGLDSYMFGFLTHWMLCLKDFKQILENFTDKVWAPNYKSILWLRVTLWSPHS